MQFWQTCWMFIRPKWKIFCSKSEKNYKLSILFKFFSPICFSGEAKCSFSYHVENISLQMRTFFCSKLRTHTQLSYSKFCFSQSDLELENAVLKMLPKKFCPKFENSSLKVQTLLVYFFFQKHIPRACSSGHVGKSYDNPFETFSFKKSNKFFSTFFRSLSEKNLKYFLYFLKFIVKMISVQEEHTFHNHAEVFRSENFLPKVREKI